MEQEQILVDQLPSQNQTLVDVVTLREESPLVSIIVPTYKRNRNFVERALVSLINQTYENIEIILVDDNAKDAHKSFRDEIFALYKELNCDSIKYIKNEENLGGALARNEGIKAANGKYITFLDDDDRYLENKVKNQIEFMIDNNLDMSFTDLRIHDGSDNLVDYREYSKIKKWDNQYLLRYHISRQIAGTNTFMYKKEVLINIGMFVKVSMGQEYYLMFNTIKSGMEIGYCNQSDVILYRQGQDCISSGVNKISGQKELYKFKKQNFSILTLRERMYTRFRHHAVMAVAYKRNKNYFKCLAEICATFFSSPIDAICEFFSFFRRIKKFKRRTDNI